MPTIHLNNLVKRYGDVQVLHGVELELADHEFTVLVGPSGCGKSTTLRMVAGLEDVSEGEIYVDGKPVSHLEPKDRDLAMVFQDYALYPHMNVAQNISFALRLARRPKAEIDAKVKDVAATVGLTEFLHRKPGALSGGQRQRVAMARALAKDSSIFLFDEPLSNLDAKLRVTMRAELKHLHHELGVTTVYVTHDQMEAMTLATRVAVMREGKIVQLDTPKKIYAEPADLFVAGFIGSPSMNLIDGAVKGGVFRADGVEVPVDLADRDGVVLGIRPEELEITQDARSAIGGKLYALELTGESTLVTLRNGPTSVCARGHADFEAEINSPCYLAPKDGARFHLFDRASGERLG